MKKSALVLSMMLVLSLFTFVGCGNDKATDMNGDEMKTEQNENSGSVVDETEKAVDDMGNAVEDGMDDVGDGVERTMDPDKKVMDKTTDKTTEKTTHQ